LGYSLKLHKTEQAGMAQKIAALTHVREDAIFLKIWLKHYSHMIGAENVFVMLDGDDWTCEVEPNGATFVTVPRNRTGEINKDDRQIDIAEARLLDKLFTDYDYVINTDADELLFLDPLFDGNLLDAASKSLEHGTFYVSGFDIVHNRETENVLDPDKPILDQRSHALITPGYMKPLIFSRRTGKNQGGHMVAGVPPHASEDVYVAHLALCDYDIFCKRYSWATDRDQHWQDKDKSKNIAFEQISDCKNIFEMDEAFPIARTEFQTRLGVCDPKRPQNFSDVDCNVVVPWGKKMINGFACYIPERFRKQI
jgi:hypothetical protein